MWTNLTPVIVTALTVHVVLWNPKAINHSNKTGAFYAVTEKKSFNRIFHF
jgi:hypothetical protein